MKNQSKNIRKRLALGKLKLDTLLEITKGINNNLSKKELSSIYKRVLIDELKIGKLILYSNSGEVWNQELCIGGACSSINVNKDLLGFKEITVLTNSTNKKLAQFDVIIPVFHKSQPLAFLLLGDFDGEKIEVSPIIKHLSFIQTITNIIIVAIENKRLFKDNMNQVAIKKEMELASEMQNMLFPSILPNNNFLTVVAKYIPHHLIGGDYYDFIQLNSDECAFCIADVSGKGIPAALLMSNFHASLHALIQRTSSLTELVIELNNKILNIAKSEKFITAFIGKYNCKTHHLQFINAGHNPPLLLVDSQFKQLNNGCTILGMFSNLPSITENNILIAKNSKLVCYTDGITEQTDKNGNEFGEGKLKNNLLKLKTSNIATNIDAIIDELDEYRGEKAYSDDIAILGIHFK